MNIQKYKNSLKILENELINFDPNKADSEYLYLGQMFDTLYQSDVLNITGFEKSLQDQFRLELFSTLTKYSGTLSFLAIQILAAHNIMTKHNFAKKEYYFHKKCGIAINHLRAPKTIVSAKKVVGGYELCGTLTWASGYKIFDTLLIGFHCEGLEFEGMAPFKSDVGFSIGVADKTFVGYGLNTVNIKLENYFIKDEDVVSQNPIGNYTKNKSISKTVHMCLYGVGVGAVNHIKDSELKNYLQTKLETLKERFMNSSDINEMDSLRVTLFDTIQKILSNVLRVPFFF